MTIGGFILVWSVVTGSMLAGYGLAQIRAGRRVRELETKLAHAERKLDYSQQQIDLAGLIAKRWTEHRERQQP